MNYTYELYLRTCYTKAGAWAHGLASGKRYFWHDELRVVITQRGKLLKNFMMGKTGAKAALIEFDTVKLKAVKSLMKVRPPIFLTQYILQIISLSYRVATSWKHGIPSLIRTVRLSRPTQKLLDMKRKLAFVLRGSRSLTLRNDCSIVNRLLALGYERRDMSCWTFKNLSAVNSSKPLTDRGKRVFSSLPCELVENVIAHDRLPCPGWNTIRPGLEKYCTKERDDRWDSERRHAREERTRKAKCLYAEYRRTILPSEWFYLPTPEQAIKLPWCTEIIERDFKITLVESDFDVSLTNLASSVEAWVREKRDHCIAMLPEEYRDAMPSSAPMIPTSLTSPSVSDVRQGKSRGNLRPFLGPLELAGAVLRTDWQVLMEPKNPSVGRQRVEN